MEAKQVLKSVLEEYQRITGLRSYIIYNEEDYKSASEKNYFCKCLSFLARRLRSASVAR
ncbi:hypothetical protein [Amedibacillus dolichus]|uniref:hypothetical protein n=1 Tax=Amedibacillus dolichus TaxID=31971 RepID=UPI0021753869|nr:hypothetical protein [Amedibacillus dolichus]